MTVTLRLSVRNLEKIVLVLLRLIDTIQQSLCVNLTNNFVKLLPTSSNIYSSKVLIKLYLLSCRADGSAAVNTPELGNDIITTAHVPSLTLTRPNYSREGINWAKPLGACSSYNIAKIPINLDAK